MLANFFEHLLEEFRDGKKFISDGKTFEDNFIKELKAFEFNKLDNKAVAKLQKMSFERQFLKAGDRSSNVKENIVFAKREWEKAKKQILDKNSDVLVENPWPHLKNSYMYHPFGKQQFPDFLFFTSKHLIPVEVKYLSNKGEKPKFKAAPVWNSNLPKYYGVYIFGVARTRVTFFLGRDVLDHDFRKLLNKFFKDLEDEYKKGMNFLKGEINKLDDSKASKKHFNPHGLKPYVRKAFDHSLRFTTSENNGKPFYQSYFSPGNENKVIAFLKEVEK